MTLRPCRSLISLVLVAGCGPSNDVGYQGATLSGTVTIDGEPAPDGSISFTPLEAGKGPMTGAQIADGSYVAEMVPMGKVRVMFAITRTAPNPEDAHSVKVTDLVPPKFRKGIEITVSGDDDAQNFDLTAAKAK